MKLIVKKSYSTSRENTMGFITPVFKEDQGDFKKIEVSEFPNNGNIFVTTGFNGFESNFFYEFESERLQENNNYENDLLLFKENRSSKNPSFKILSYYHNSNEIKKVSPNNFVSIYDNKFSLNSNKLLETGNIESEIFFLKDLNLAKMFGPFKRNGIELEAASFRAFEDEFENDDEFLEFLEIYSQFDGSVIFEISLDVASNFLISDHEGSEFLVDFKNFINNNIGIPIDFTPINKLHKWAIDKLKDSAPRISETLSEIKNVIKDNNAILDKLKWNKYISHLDDLRKDQEDIDLLVKKLSDKKFIDLEVDNSILEKLNIEIEKVKLDRDFKSDEIINLKNKIEEIENDLFETSNKSQGNQLIDSALYPNLHNVLNDSEKIDEIEQLLNSKENLSDLEREYWKLEGKKENLHATVTELEDKKNEVTNNIKSISNIFKTDAKDYTAKLAEAKIYTDLLNGIEILPNSSQNEISLKVEVNIVSPNIEPNTAKGYVSEIQKRLKNQGRDFDFNEVANLIITINQTFITIIAGAPGVGKTSLVEKLSKSYGLDENFGYLEISCAKGWTSSKDLIGFYNPLTNKFQPSKTKLIDALKNSEAYPNAPYIVLLDEANLSPIEHYWSDFIKLADSNYSRKIKISDSDEIRFGDGFRFIATINHDHTTESLSNRLIDRAAIIQIEKPDVVNEINEITNNVENICDFSELQNLFTPTSKWKSEEGSIREILKNIKEKLELNSGLILSPRKEIAIIKYCKVATGLLEGNSYTALDYAISQHVLPLINGRGENFESMLKVLKDALIDKEMTKSEKILNKIIERGKELKHFRYIYY